MSSKNEVASCISLNSPSEHSSGEHSYQSNHNVEIAGKSFDDEEEKQHEPFK